MRYMARQMIAVAILTTASSASAQDDKNTSAVGGLGVDSCASFVLALNDNRPTEVMRYDDKLYYTKAAAYSQWLFGFVASATHPSVGKRRGINVDANGIAYWAKKYCEENLSMIVAIGALRSVEAHR